MIDSGLENKDLTKALVRRYYINRVVVSSYYTTANSIIERAYRPIVNALSKITNGNDPLKEG